MRLYQQTRKSRQSLPLLVASLATAVFYNGASEAADRATIMAQDLNENNFIENGDERAAVLALGPQLSAVQFAIAKSDDEFKGKLGVPIGDFFEDSYQEIVAARCSVEKRFFLQDKVSSVSVLYPGLAESSKSGASFSVTYDHLEDETFWSAEGALFYIPRFSKRCVGDPRLANRNLGFVSGYAFAPFVFFDGEGSDTTPGKSTLQFGVKSEVQVFSGPFDVQHFSFNPYYQTDFDFDAEIYGLSASWKPVKLDYGLNGFRKSGRVFQPSWTFLAEADYRSVQTAGNSGLTAGTEYGWFGAIIGASVDIVPKKANPLFAKVEYHAFHDVINDVNATRLVGELGMYLDADRRSALTLKYENGTNYSDLTDTEKTTVTFKLAF